MAMSNFSHPFKDLKGGGVKLLSLRHCTQPSCIPSLSHRSFFLNTLTDDMCVKELTAQHEDATHLPSSGILARSPASKHSAFQQTASI
jgi:hypothetical protein